MRHFFKFIFVFLIFVSHVFAGQFCELHFAQLEQAHPSTYTLLVKMESFADKHKLPKQILEVGPAERKVKRMFIGLDASDPKMMEDYFQTFNLEKGNKKELGGELVLEFQYEVPDNYVTGVLRPSGDNSKEIYRWGKKDLTHQNWWDQWLLQDRGAGGKDRPIYGFGHIIGLSPDEVTNVKVFLENPQLRAPCKSDNCVAWTSSIELGKTFEGASDQERMFLFSKLGMARSMAHFEIGRRLVHASNEVHSGIFVFYNGEKGLEAFNKSLQKFLPPDPKIPYSSIIKNMGFANDSPIMQAMNIIPDGGKVFFPIAAGASPEAAAALMQKALTMEKGYEFHLLVNGISEATLNKVTLPESKIQIKALFLGGNLRKLHAEGHVDVIPGYLADFPKMMKDPEFTQFNYDAIVVRVSPPNEKGLYSLGPNHDMIMTIIKNKPNVKVIAEVNPNVPFTNGKNFLRKKQIHAFYESKSALAASPVVPPSEVDSAIGENIGKLVQSDGYLQVGIGNVFNGLKDGLVNNKRKNIKIFTEMFGDSLMDVMQSGVATEAKTGFAFGSEGLYKWLDKNESISFESTEFVNDPGLVSEMENFHAVNTALQVNLRGDVNATMGPGGVRISSPGGQVEFMSGAARSKGGKAIIAIRSTAKNGELSTIVMDLYSTTVTTPHESVTHVVTEFGIAVLKGQTERMRAVNLINVAHPKFRSSLFQDALAKGMVKDVDQQLIKLE